MTLCSPFQSRSLAALEDWLKSLESATLHAQLVENVSNEAWSHHFDEEDWKRRVNELAQQLYADPAAFSTELPWLNSSDAKAAAELGHFFGRLDAASLRFLRHIIDAALEQDADAFARGYIYGITESAQSDLSALNQELDRVQNANPRLAFYIMLPAGDLVRAFERALEMVNSHTIAARLLSNLQVWVGNRKTKPAEAGQAVRALLPIARKDDHSAVDVALDFVAYQINRVGENEKPMVLAQIFSQEPSDLWVLLEMFVEQPGREDFWFARVVKAVADLDPVRGCDIASRMIVGKSFPMKDEGEKLLGELAERYPRQVMEAIGRRITDEKTKDQFFVRKYSFLSQIPLEVITTWLQEVGEPGARAIARHLPAPQLDSNGQPVVPPLTAFVLTHFEADDATFREFVTGIHSFQGYRGSYSEARRKEGLEAKHFLTHPFRRIREWARIEVREAEEDVRVHGIREDEDLRR